MTDVDQKWGKVVLNMSMVASRYFWELCMHLIKPNHSLVCLSFRPSFRPSVNPSLYMLVKITNCIKFTLSCSEFKNFISNRFYHLCYQGDLILFK